MVPDPPGAGRVCDGTTASAAPSTVTACGPPSIRTSTTSSRFHGSGLTSCSAATGPDTPVHSGGPCSMQCDWAVVLVLSLLAHTVCSRHGTKPPRSSATTSDAKFTASAAGLPAFVIERAEEVAALTSNGEAIPPFRTAASARREAVHHEVVGEFLAFDPVGGNVQQWLDDAHAKIMRATAE